MQDDFIKQVRPLLCASLKALRKARRVLTENKHCIYTRKLPESTRFGAADRSAQP